MELLLKVTARLLSKGTNAPFNGPEVRVKVYDKDLFDDDFMGEGTPDEHGEVEIAINLEKARSSDSPFESLPDLYLVIFRDGQEIFRTGIMQDVDPQQQGDFNSALGLRLNLGTYLV